MIERQTLQTDAGSETSSPDEGYVASIACPCLNRVTSA